jgi:hypothetical protein
LGEHRTSLALVNNVKGYFNHKKWKSRGGPPLYVNESIAIVSRRPTDDKAASSTTSW